MRLLNLQADFQQLGTGQFEYSLTTGITKCSPTSSSEIMLKKEKLRSRSGSIKEVNSVLGKEKVNDICGGGFRAGDRLQAPHGGDTVDRGPNPLSCPLRSVTFLFHRRTSGVWWMAAVASSSPSCTSFCIDHTGVKQSFCFQG